MDKSTEIQRRVEASLNSLDNVQQADPGPYFITRVLARIHREKSKWDELSAFIARPAVAIAVICLVIVMNTWAVLQQKETTTGFADQFEQPVYDDEASLAVRSFYDYENIEP